MARISHFDTLDYAKKLEAAGVPVRQAELQSQLLADVISDSVALPADIERIQAVLSENMVISELKLSQKIEASESRLNQKIEASESRLNQKIEASESRLNQKIEASVSELNQKIGTSVSELNQKINTLELRMFAEFEKMRGDVTLLKWMLGALIGVGVPTLLKIAFS